jgi:beta-lactamase regulating signal transducer with metallopeptidase domain
MILGPVLDASANFSAHVVEPAARSLAFACVAGLVIAAFRVRSVALRLAIWRTVLVVALAMPLLGLLLPPLPVFVPLAAKFVPAKPAAEIAPAAEIHSRAMIVNQVAHSSSTKLGAFTYTGQAPETMGATSGSDITDATGVPQLVDVPAAIAQPRPPFPWLAASTAIYFSVAIFMLIRLALGVILGRRLERESQLVEDSHALARLRFFAQASGLRGSRPRLAESELLSVPVTFGVRRPAILLPAGWREWEPAELDAVLAHEISHVVRRDALAERLSLLHRAIFWFSPLSWWLARHLADLAEEASDDAALASGADRTRYAETLLGFFVALEAAPGRVWWQGVSMATAGQAEKRVDRILEWKGSVAMRLKKPVVIACMLCAIPVVCLIAAFRPTIINIHSDASQQTAPQATEPPALAPQQSAQSPAAPASVPGPANAPQPSAAPAAAPGAAPDPIPLAPLAPEVSVRSVVRPIVSVDPVVSVHTVVTPLGLANVRPVVSVAPVVRVVPIVPVPPVGGPVPSVAPVVIVHPSLSPLVQSTTISNGTISGDNGGEEFTIVAGNFAASVSSNNFTISSDGNSDVANSLRRSFPGDFIWFIRDGKAYIIRDAATIKQAMDFFAPTQELGRKQEELGKQLEALGAQQEALGAKQEALGEQMEKVRVKIPDLTAELEKLQADLKKLGADGTQDDLGRIQEKIGEIQSRIGELQSKAGEEQAKLGEKQGALGEEQGKLGEQQGKLGEMQGRLGEQQEAASRKASREMKKLLDQAIASGLAKPA